MSAQSSVSAGTPAPTPAPSSSTSAAAGGAADESTSTQEDIRKHLPARFDGQDKDLLDAEASIDPLVNNAPPTPSGMDIN